MEVVVALRVQLGLDPDPIRGGAPFIRLKDMGLSKPTLMCLLMGLLRRWACVRWALKHTEVKLASPNENVNGGAGSFKKGFLWKGTAKGADANEDLLDVWHHSLDVLLRNGPCLHSKGLILDEFFLNMVGQEIHGCLQKEFGNFLGQFSSSITE